MTTTQRPPLSDELAIAQLHEMVEVQRTAFEAERYPTLEVRKDRLRALAAGLVRARDDIRVAVDADFGTHAHAFTDMAEVLAPVARCLYLIEHLDELASPSKRFLDPASFGESRGAMRYQPKGVIGNMVPWNFPIELALGPTADMLAAGNRVILKPSELAPATGEVLRDIVRSTFDPDLVNVVVGGHDLSVAFPQVRWDHLLFTGGVDVGRSVAMAAAQNLTPVTLELGGKSPAIVTPGHASPSAVASILRAKLMNSGQVCIAPDYVLVHRSDLETFAATATSWMSERFADFTTGPSGTGIISERHLSRLQDLLAEASTAGVEVVELGGSEVREETRQMPFYLVVDPPLSLRVMTEEIFGPILPIVPYDSVDEATEFVNSRERPLGLYVFSEDMPQAERLLQQTTSGGACINACGSQVQHDIGFGGSGASGYGRHHGPEGFREFSNHRGVFVSGTGDLSESVSPPYDDGALAMVSSSFDAIEAALTGDAEQGHVAPVSHE